MLKVNQWLSGWDKVDYSVVQHRRKPMPHFYLLSLPASELRTLCGIARRRAKSITPRAADLGIQRELDIERTEEIARFVEFGFPWSTLSESKRRAPAFNNLRKPGWLPTAILVNILGPNDKRQGRKVSEGDLIEVDDKNNTMQLPYQAWTKDWTPKELPPLEIIDGQHRLWAFGDERNSTSFDVPIVAFSGLDISWQAYLFWTINIKPKRINPSLAFDLYPLLRGEDWLDSDEAHSVYRETRSQELTEALWSHPASPWYDRINMLGERQIRWVSQSAWIRSLLATLVRPWEGRRSRMGGLFGSRLNQDGEVLGWTRAQQAAFLLFAWNELRVAIKSSTREWAIHLRRIDYGEASTDDDPAFYGKFSLIITDQGVRGYLHVLNDLCFSRAPNLKLDTWRVDGSAAATDEAAVTTAMKSLAKHAVGEFITKLAKGLATFDWRTSSTPDLPEDLRRQKLVFRGGSGYKEIRIQLLEHLSDATGDVATAARRFVQVN